MVYVILVLMVICAFTCVLVFGLLCQDDDAEQTQPGICPWHGPWLTLWMFAGDKMCKVGTHGCGLARSSLMPYRVKKAICV